MRSKLEYHEDYQRMIGNYNLILLVGAHKGHNFKFDRKNHLPHTLHGAKRNFYWYYQRGYTTNPQYLENIDNKVLLIESYYRSINNDPWLAKK